MAVVVTQEFEATRDEYEAVDAKIGDAPPHGLILHTVSTWGETNGSWWTSGSQPRTSRASCRSQLIPAIAEVNPDAPQAPEPEILEVHTLREGLSRTDPLPRLKEKTEMAVIMEMEMQVTPDQYDAVDAATRSQGRSARRTDRSQARFDGDTLKVLDIWESEEAFGAFAESRLGPGVAETLGDDAPDGPPQPKFTDLHNAYSV